MKKTLREVIDILKISYALDKVAIVFTILVSFVRSVKPYIAIALSGYILNSFVADVSFEQIVLVAICGVSLVFVINIIEGIMEKYRIVQVDICIRKFNMEKCKKTLTMDYELIESPMINQIRSRIRTDNTWGAGFSTVFSQFSEFMYYCFALIIGLIMLVPLFVDSSFFENWLTPVYFVVLIAITIFLSLFDAKYINKKKNKLMDETANDITYLDYFLLNQIDYKLGKDIRIYDAENIIKKSLDSGWERWQKIWTRSFTKVNAVGGAVNGLSSGILEGGAYILVIMRAYAGALSVGGVVVYASIIYNFSQNIASLLNCISRFALTAKRQQSSLEYLNVPNKICNGTHPVEMRSDGEYEYEFKNVSFKYLGSESYALKDITLKLNARQRIAVVGMNGSGKTTLIKLLCRMYEPTEGEITMNGININEYDYDEYMRIFSVVFQDFKLFSFSLGQNIAADAKYNTAKAIDAVNKSGFSQRLADMPKGLESNMYSNFDDGIEISGGEAQKIAIARALYKDAPFIILDEPTAALDPISEFEVFSKFDEIVGKKSAIYISHRLSSCRFCDDILVLHEGRLIQRGDHNDLVGDRQGKYYELWNAQAQHYCE